MSTAAIFSASLLDDSLAITPTQGANQTAPSTNTFSVTIAATSSPSSSTSTSTNTPDVLTQDLINLLKALATGDTSGAKSDLAKFQTDLKAQSASSSTNNIASDTANTSSTQTGSPLESLLTTISSALNSGNTQSALQDLANYLVQNGQASGGLINTST